jgi:hypothetical protein
MNVAMVRTRLARCMSAFVAVPNAREMRPGVYCQLWYVVGFTGEKTWEFRIPER